MSNLINKYPNIENWDDYEDLNIDLLREFIHMVLKNQVLFNNKVFYLLLINMI